MPKIAAFVGRSFSPEDESKIKPILRHLDTFHPLGFTWDTAEQAEMESVSLKVRKMIDASNVFVGILTKRYPILDLSRPWRLALQIGMHSASLTRWTAPAWIIQEAGYAQRAGLKLIIFREEGVEIPGLQGDLEYIQFAAHDYATAFQRASEMINREIGKQSGILVETTVNTIAPEGENKQIPSESAEPKEDSTVRPGLAATLRDLYVAVQEKRFDEAAIVYTTEAERLEREGPGESIWLEAFYCRWRFQAGDESALTELRALAERAPNNWQPRACIAECLNDYNEFVATGHAYLEAAGRSDGKKSAGFMISAARAFRRGTQFLDAKNILLGVSTDERAEFKEQRGEALKELYEVYKDSDERYDAVAIGELELYENPALSDFRFQLAYDCDEWKFTEMSIHHYALLREKQPDNAAVIHNLGVAYSKRDLKILSVEAYKKAIELGETLAAMNLAYKYLDGGMADDASIMVLGAMERDLPDPGLPKVLAAIEEKRNGELEKTKSFEDSAEGHRAFALVFSVGLLKPLACGIEGTWKFPFAAISLQVSGEHVVGSGESTGDPHSMPLTSMLLSGLSEPAPRQKKRYTLSGQLSGRTCRFTVTAEVLAAMPVIGSMDQPRDGYIVFSESCDSARVTELKDELPYKYYDLKRA